ncbi:hypothetical protein Trydic_g16936 [Trypoxylus dichotomus]
MASNSIDHILCYHKRLNTDSNVRNDVGGQCTGTCSHVEWCSVMNLNFIQECIMATRRLDKDVRITPLYFLLKDICTQPWELCLNVQHYVDEEVLPHTSQFLKQLEDLLSQQDNIRPHLVRIFLNRLQEDDVDIFPWPPKPNGINAIILMKSEGV